MGLEDQYVFLTRGCNLACIHSTLTAWNLNPNPYCHCLDCSNWLICSNHAYLPEQENRTACWQTLDTSLLLFSVQFFSKVALVWICSHSINVYSHCLSSPYVSLWGAVQVSFTAHLIHSSWYKFYHKIKLVFFTIGLFTCFHVHVGDVCLMFLSPDFPCNFKGTLCG